MEQTNKNKWKVKKVLLMGKAGVGKTSMKSIIFANSSPKQTFSLGYTLGVAHSRLNLMGNVPIELMDCGGQNEFMEEYFFSRKDEIFPNTEVFIFVIEAFDYGDPKVKTNKSRDFKENFKNSKDYEYFTKCLDILKTYTKSAKIFILIHKFDLILPRRREFVSENIEECLKKTSENIGYELTNCFATSIWQVSLYKAWTNIVTSLLPDYELLQEYLKDLCESCNAEEVALFDKTAFLALAYYSKNKAEIDQERFESLSIIIKKFQINFSSLGISFTSLIHKMNNYNSVLLPFTKDTFLVMLGKSINSEMLELNLDLTRNQFQKLIF